MSSIHYFQRYSTKENSVTNNTLLLLSRLYETFPDRFFSLFVDLADVTLNGAKFQQQVREKGKGSIPDGVISQAPFKVIVETKLDKGGFHKGQLRGHLAYFPEATLADEARVLLLLAPSRISLDEIEAIDPGFIMEAASKNVQVRPCSFGDLIEKYREVINEWDGELVAIWEDFRGYCTEMGLLAGDEVWMRVVTSGVSMPLNVELSLYAAPSDRGYSQHSYLGLYADKAVKYVGRLLSIAEIESNDGRLEVVGKPEVATPSAEQLARAAEYIEKARAYGWDVRSGHKFFFVEKFAQTAFKKTSPRGLWQTRFFDLRKMGADPSAGIDAVAAALATQTWA